MSEPTPVVKTQAGQRLLETIARWQREIDNARAAIAVVEATPGIDEALEALHKARF